MKVLHICICGPFTDGFSYQENELVEQHVALGHEVIVIASRDTYTADGKIIPAEVGSSQLRCGATIIRLAYKLKMWSWLASKVRACRGLGNYLEQIKPEYILFHGLTAWDLLTVAAYVRCNNNVKLFVDCHEDFNNSAKTWLSRQFLHRFFYKLIFLRCIDQFQEVLCVTVESLHFALNFYNSPKSKTRLYPLGCKIESAEIIFQRRAEFRAMHGLLSNNIVITQTGKLDSTKNLKPALQAFCANTSPMLRFIIAGRMSDDVKSACLPLIKSDSRVIDLGWQSTDALRSVLAGSDCFLQPFGQTVTTQMAMAYGCVILAQDLPSHRWLVRDSGCLFDGPSNLEAVFNWVVDNQFSLEQLKKKTAQFAVEQLDYRQLARQILT